MVYTCKHCGNTTMRAYSTSDGLEQGLCALCVAEYEKELKVNTDSEVVKDLETKFDKKIQGILKRLVAINDRMIEHEVKMGNLEKRIEALEEQSKQLQNSIDELSTERVKQVKGVNKK